MKLAFGKWEERNNMTFNTWELIRLFGLISYFYFTISIVFGLLRKTHTIQSKKNLLYQIHQSAGWFGFIALVVHMLLLIIDSYEPYSFAELMIPFISDYQPISSSIGTIAFYLFFIVIITSDLWIRKMKFAIWKWVHLAILPAWFMSLIHGLFIGTDTENPIILTFYVITIVSVSVTFSFRHLFTKTKINKNTVNKQAAEGQ